MTMNKRLTMEASNAFDILASNDMSQFKLKVFMDFKFDDAFALERLVELFPDVASVEVVICDVEDVNRAREMFAMIAFEVFMKKVDQNTKMLAFLDSPWCLHKIFVDGIRPPGTGHAWEESLKKVHKYNARQVPTPTLAPGGGSFADDKTIAFVLAPVSNINLFKDARIVCMGMGHNSTSSNNLHGIPLSCMRNMNLLLFNNMMSAAKGEQLGNIEYDHAQMVERCTPTVLTNRTAAHLDTCNFVSKQVVKLSGFARKYLDSSIPNVSEPAIVYKAISDPEEVSVDVVSSVYAIVVETKRAVDAFDEVLAQCQTDDERRVELQRITPEGAKKPLNFGYIHRCAALLKKRFDAENSRFTAFPFLDLEASDAYHVSVWHAVLTGAYKPTPGKIVETPKFITFEACKEEEATAVMPLNVTKSQMLEFLLNDK